MRVARSGKRNVEGDDHAARRKIQLYRQAETPGRTHRGGIRASRRGKTEAERRAWATVNKETGGGNKSGSGRGVPDTNVSSKRGGRIGGPRGGMTSASGPAAARSRSAKKAAATRKRNAAARSGARKTARKK